MKLLPDTFMALSEDIRYVAVYDHGELATSSKSDSPGASSSESDKYEELIVNPTILTLAKQRGDIDCGGAKYVLIRYGNFFQVVVPTDSGHVSICVEPYADPLKLIDPIMRTLDDVASSY